MSGLRSQIDEHYIANSICQDIHTGYYVMVEGSADELFFHKFLDLSICQIEICHGKENLLKAVSIINSRKTVNKDIVGIVDKDYDFINPSHIPAHNIIETDCHDVELMCLKSDSFENVVREYFSKDKVDILIARESNKPLKDILIGLALPLAKLRVLNYRLNLGLRFQPKTEGMKELKYTKFIDRGKFEFCGYDSLINTVKNYYTQAPSLDNSDIKNKISAQNIAIYSAYDICHGHDLTKIIAIGMAKKLGKASLDKVTSHEIERALRLAFSKEDFDKTQIKTKLIQLNPDLIKK